MEDQTLIKHQIEAGFAPKKVDLEFPGRPQATGASKIAKTVPKPLAPKTVPKPHGRASLLAGSMSPDFKTALACGISPRWEGHVKLMGGMIGGPCAAPVARLVGVCRVLCPLPF